MSLTPPRNSVWGAGIMDSARYRLQWVLAEGADLGRNRHYEGIFDLFLVLTAQCSNAWVGAVCQAFTSGSQITSSTLTDRLSNPSESHRIYPQAPFLHFDSGTAPI